MSHLLTTRPRINLLEAFRSEWKLNERWTDEFKKKEWKHIMRITLVTSITKIAQGKDKRFVMRVSSSVGWKVYTSLLQIAIRLCMRSTYNLSVLITWTPLKSLSVNPCANIKLKSKAGGESDAKTVLLKV